MIFPPCTSQRDWPGYSLDRLSASYLWTKLLAIHKSDICYLHWTRSSSTLTTSPTSRDNVEVQTKDSVRIVKWPIFLPLASLRVTQIVLTLFHTTQQVMSCLGHKVPMAMVRGQISLFRITIWSSRSIQDIITSYRLHSLLQSTSSLSSWLLIQPSSNLATPPSSARFAASHLWRPSRYCETSRIWSRVASSTS